VTPYQVCGEERVNSVEIIVKQLTHADDDFKCYGPEQATHLQIFSALPKYRESCVGKNRRLRELSATRLL
jgi:hypothetical protein